MAANIDSVTPIWLDDHFPNCAPLCSPFYNQSVEGHPGDPDDDLGVQIHVTVQPPPSGQCMDVVMIAVDEDDPDGPRLMNPIVEAPYCSPAEQNYNLSFHPFRAWQRSTCYHPGGGDDGSDECAGSIKLKTYVRIGGTTDYFVSDIVDGVVNADWDIYDGTDPRFYWSPNAFKKPAFNFTTESMPAQPNPPLGDFVTVQQGFSWYDIQGGASKGSLRLDRLRAWLQYQGYFKLEMNRQTGDGQRLDKWDAFYLDDGDKVFYQVAASLPSGFEFNQHTEEYKVHWPELYTFDSCAKFNEPCQEEFQLRVHNDEVGDLVSTSVTDPSLVLNSPGGGNYFVSVKFYRAFLGSSMLLDSQFELQLADNDDQFDTVDFYQLPVQS